MANKKQTKKKSKKPAGKKAAPAKKQAKKKSVARKSAKKKAVPKRAAAKKKGLKKTASPKTAKAGTHKIRTRSQGRGSSAFPRETSGSHSGEQSGDMQGLSNLESVDSESVDELMEEGNAFEAEAVSGVEDADDHDEREVHTHEVPEDDVPGEYLDEE
jgi:hypothetical protein